MNAVNRAKDGNGRLHLCGLVSDGGVHSHINHLLALLKVAKELGVPNVFVHFFGDGRDTSPTSGGLYSDNLWNLTSFILVKYLEQLIDYLKETNYGELATIVGRYYAMDRDTRWERTCVAYDAMVANVGEQITLDKAIDTIKERYAKDQTDEFLTPIVFGERSRVKGWGLKAHLDFISTCRRRHNVVFQLPR